MTCVRGSRHNFHMASNPATLFSVTAVILLMTAIARENSDNGLGGDSRAATPRLTVITVTPVPIATVDAASSVVSETALPPTVPAAVALVATPNEAISALMPATVPIVAALSSPIPIIQVTTIPTRTTLGADTLATPSSGPALTPPSQATIAPSSTLTRAQTAIPTVMLPPTFTPTPTATEKPLRIHLRPLASVGHILAKLALRLRSAKARPILEPTLSPTNGTSSTTVRRSAP